MEFRIDRFVLFWALQFAWALGKKLFKMETIFLVYPGSDADYNGYFPKWMRRFLPVAFPIGMVGRNTLVMATARSTQELEKEPEQLTAVRDCVAETATMIGADAVALAGRLPGIMIRNEVGLELPFVPGTTGTVFTCDATVEATIKAKANCKHSDVTVGVLGVGFVGSALIAHWARNGYKRIIGVDKLVRPSVDDPRVMITTDPAALADVDILVILVEEGSQVEAAISHLKKTCIVLDDTHPQLPRTVRDKLRAEGIKTFKVAVRNHIRFFPRLPGFGHEWLPGCLIEALVTASNGGYPIADQRDFGEAATKLGLHAVRVEHRYEGRLWNAGS